VEDAHEEKAAYIGFSELQGQAVWLQNFFSRRQQADALRAHEVAIRTLVSAAQRGDLNTLRSLRAEGADLRAHADLLANTAIASGQVDVVRFLHDNGFLASACSLESIRSALKSHHWSTLNYVFQQGCQIPAETSKLCCQVGKPFGQPVPDIC
jgi:hypothetical protein